MLPSSGFNNKHYLILYPQESSIAETSVNTLKKNLRQVYNFRVLWTGAELCLSVVLMEPRYDFIFRMCSAPGYGELAHPELRHYSFIWGKG